MRERLLNIRRMKGKPRMEERIDHILGKKLSELSEPEKRIIQEVWNNKDSFIKWPREGKLLLPGLTRPKKGFHTYPRKIVEEFKSKGIRIDTRTNGPAIMSYLFAGGERPGRREGKQEWAIHHIYDGKFPFAPGTKSLRAVEDGEHFTHSAGLVAIHPIAEALADEYFYFAWLLRRESFIRFNYDPDKVFLRTKK